MKAAALVVLLGALPLPRGAAQQHTLMADTLLALLGQIADTATVEHIRCGFADLVNGKPMLARWITPVVIEANRTGLWAAKCPHGTAVVWHSHVAPEDGPAWQYCALSPEDVAMILSSPRRVYIVQVRSDVWCQWTTEQVRAALEGHLWPVPGQYVFGPERPR